MPGSHTLFFLLLSLSNRGKSAPNEFIDELLELADNFDQRFQVDTCRAYHFGPKFLVELEVVMPETTLLKESHDLGMELQYEIEAQEDVERCFVHIDYETRDYDEHVVSKVPELREQLLRRRAYKGHASV
jgi:divalent metal cation (Fe/Co/Zn/Cd) transporter